jgi:hypothetical protein
MKIVIVVSIMRKRVMPLTILPLHYLPQRRHHMPLTQLYHFILKQHVEQLVTLGYIKHELHLIFLSWAGLEECTSERFTRCCAHPLGHSNTSFIIITDRVFLHVVHARFLLATGFPELAI